MKLAKLAPAYILWHYTRGLVDCIKLGFGFVLFFFHFFSIPILLRTFFTPWQKLEEKYSKDLDPKKFFSALIINILMRTVGAIIRLLTIIVGLVSVLSASVLAIFVFLFWLVLPILIVALAVLLVLFIITSIKDLVVPAVSI